MLVDYSNQDGFAQGFKDTFSGEKPCALCCKIKAAKQGEGKDSNPLTPATSLSSKMLQEMIPAAEIVLYFPISAVVSSVSFMDAIFLAGIGADAPPIPPPCRVA